MHPLLHALFGLPSTQQSEVEDVHEAVLEKNLVHLHDSVPFVHDVQGTQGKTGGNHLHGVYPPGAGTSPNPSGWVTALTFHWHWLTSLYLDSILAQERGLNLNINFCHI